MAHFYVNTDSDSIYIDVTAGDHSPVTMVTAADGVFLHLDESRMVVGIEVRDVGQRGVGYVDEPAMGHLHVNPTTDSFYLDVSAGTRSPVSMAPVADEVYVHVDVEGGLVGVEVLDLSRRGGLHVSDLDATPGSVRPALFDEIERVAGNGRLGSHS